MKRWQTISLGFLISGIALYLVFRQIQFTEIIRVFRTARYGYVVVSGVLVIGLTLLRGLRWSILTNKRMTPMDGFWLFNIGFLFNNLLPARIGEIVRAVLAGRRPEMHFSSALSTIVVERLFDMVSLLVLIGIVLTQLELPSLVTSAGLVIGAGAGVGIAVLAYAAQNPDGALKLGSTVLSWLPGISREKSFEFLQPFVEGLSGVSDWRVFGTGLGLSIFIWILSSGVAWIMMLAFWESPRLIEGMLAIAAAGTGIAVPAAPAGLGPFEAAVTFALQAVGYEADKSGSFALMLHAMNFLMTSSFGILGLAREGIGFREVMQQAREHNVKDNMVHDE